MFQIKKKKSFINLIYILKNTLSLVIFDDIFSHYYYYYYHYCHEYHYYYHHN